MEDRDTGREWQDDFLGAIEAAARRDAERER
jgi:hypothetical protein